jgi:hypothetical protein
LRSLSRHLAGALFFYLKDQLAAFLKRTAGCHIEFRLTCMLAEELADHLRKEVMLRVLPRLQVAPRNC